MRKILILITVLVPLLAGLITGLRLIGSGRAAPVKTLFTDPAGNVCSPSCLFGVRPGETLFPDAIRALLSHPVTSTLTLAPRGDIIEMTGPSISVSLLRSRRGVVASISLRFEPTRSFGYRPADPLAAAALQSLTMGDAMAHFGAPPKVHLAQRTTRLVRMYYPEQGVLLTGQVEGNTGALHLDIHDALLYMSLSTPEWFREVWRSPLLSAVDWDGFGTVNRYARAARP